MKDECKLNKTIKTDKIISLNGSWSMKDFSIGIGYQKKIFLPKNQPKDCLPYQVPGTVVNSLLKYGHIPDPYFGYDNEKSLWIEHKEWWFFKNFYVDKNLKGKHIELDFEGISFAGHVWLNGQLVGEVKGMLNPKSFEVSKLLKYGKNNNITVCLAAPPDARENTIKFGLTWSSQRDQLYSIAQCIYGWDWGPHNVGIGIWQPVQLRIFDQLKIINPYINTQILHANKANCNIKIEIKNLSDKILNAYVIGLIRQKKSYKLVGTFKQKVKLNPAEIRTLEFNASINNPKLWWPNGMGEQNLYILNAKAFSRNKESDNISIQFGIRELKLIENENISGFIKTMHKDIGDSHHLGNVVGSYPWTFQINGIKMFAKGGNWIPIDQLLRLDYIKYKHLLKLFKDAHFNMLRVWGGGLYETKYFYNLCDEYGILTWQEFLSNRNFSNIDRENFLDGAKSAILRLRNHPSLSLWCGGNEFDPDDLGSKAVIDSLAEILKTFDPQREFHRASPYRGDDHYWGVWHLLEPYTKYRIVRPFRSEAGLNAPPVWENYIKFTPHDLLWPPNKTFIEYHGESNIRFQHLSKLFRYANEFGKPLSLEELITKSQLYQAIGNEFNMEFCRSNKFRNSGFLLWQYNDIWPCLSWSIVDWYGTPKPSYYFLKRASKPIHISVDYEKYIWSVGEMFKADIYLLNDTQLPIKEHSFVGRLFNCNGRILYEKHGCAESSENSSKKISEIEFFIPNAMEGKTFFISVELKNKSAEKISDTLYPIAVSKNEKLEEYNDIFSEINNMPKVFLDFRADEPNIIFNKNKIGKGILNISNPSENIAFFIRIKMLEESDKLHAFYEDNYVSLLPREIKKIFITINYKVAQILPKQIHFEASGINCPVQVAVFNVIR